MRHPDRRKSRHLESLILGLLVGLSACNPPMPKVSVEGEPGAIDALAGHWEGSYESEKNGREGTIRFDLTAAGDTARGEVLMMPNLSREPYQGSARGETRERRPVREPSVLTIRFVRAQHDQVLGTLDTYIDPDCDCRVTTNFIGSVDGDEARGVFAIRGMKSWLAYGEWRARRVPAATH